MNRQRAQEYITDHEGRRNRAYPDSRGIQTIGIGMNLEEDRNRERVEEAGLDYNAVLSGEVTVDDKLIDQWFGEDLDIAISDALATLNDYWSHPEDVQIAIVDMSFQLGGPRLKKFINMIAALDSRPPDYLKAAAEIANSKYAKQTPNRAADNIQLVRGCAV
jgi:GH24 family phage-related lysozyme (muramidase)